MDCAVWLLTLGVSLEAKFSIHNRAAFTSSYKPLKYCTESVCGDLD